MIAPDIEALIAAIEKVGLTMEPTDQMYQDMISTSVSMVEAMCGDDDHPDLCALKALQNA